MINLFLNKCKFFNYDVFIFIYFLFYFYLLFYCKKRKENEELVLNVYNKHYFNCLFNETMACDTVIKERKE